LGALLELKRGAPYVWQGDRRKQSTSAHRWGAQAGPAMPELSFILPTQARHPRGQQASGVLAQADRKQY